MKKIFLFTITLLLIFAALNFTGLNAYAERWVNFSFCDRPVFFRLGSIDPNFNINREDLLEDVEAAASIWNEAIDKEIFVYSNDAALTINLVYDQRQGSISQINQQKTTVEEQKAQFDRELSKYEQDKQRVQQTLNQLNEDISQWNLQGGAPEEVYNDLIEKQKDVQAEIDQINQATQKINQTVDELNSQIDQVNEKVEKFNNLLNFTPEEGLFIGPKNRIEIYIYDDQKGFRHTVAHELGHALGLDHVEKENSIMHPVSSSDSHFSNEDRALLATYCQEKNIADVVKNDLKVLLHRLFSEINNVLPLTT